MSIIECVEGQYEAHDGEFAKIYRWCPECFLVKCDGGRETSLSDSDTTCAWCGADHISIIQEELVPRWLEDEAVHPWRYSGTREEPGILAGAVWS
jgi:hypothetical protein